MKLTLAALTLFTLAGAHAQTTELDAMDPTQPSPRMRSAMAAEVSGIPAVTVKGMVLGSSKSGTVMLDFTGHIPVLARPLLPFTVNIGGIPKKLVIKAITPDGIELEAPVEKESALIPCYGPASDAVPAKVDVMAFVQFSELPLLDALRMLANQSGNNYSASTEANKTLVNALLRNISANSVVEEICKSHNLWFKRDEVSQIIRIMSLKEFERDLVGFGEEQTEVFTLMYPNVAEIATSIADLFGDRVQLSLGAETIEEDARDLNGRFNRFDILQQRSQQLNGQQNNNALGGVNSIYGQGGFGNNGNGNGIGFGQNFGDGNGSGFGGNGRNSFFRQRNNQLQNQSNQTAEQEANPYRNLTPEQAQRLELALAAPVPNANGEATVQALRQKPSNIFVTASRRNNMVVVRTADSRAMVDIRALIRRMDVPTPLVLLEVQVLSVRLGDDFRSVFDYQYGDGTTGGMFTQGNIERPLSGGALLGGAGLNSGDMTFVVVSNNFRARMQLLEQKNRVVSVASPILLTANNEVSRLFLGEERPIVRNITSRSFIGDNTIANTPITETEFRSVGTTLLITPNINSDRTVTLRLLQENSVINAGAATIPVINTNANSKANSVQNVPVDVVASRSVSGTFVAKDGMAVAIGGLIEDKKKLDRAQVPFIGRIPLVGTLFSRQEKGESREELVVVVKPHVISTPSEAEQISDNLLKKLSVNETSRLRELGLLPKVAGELSSAPKARVVREEPSAPPPPKPAQK